VRSRRVCRWVVAGFACAYVVALAIYLTAVFGLFGQPRDPLGVVYLLPLGLPWNLLLENAAERLRPWLAALAPTINLVLLAGLCRLGNRQCAKP
jgi:hypothetical protein